MLDAIAHSTLRIGLFRFTIAPLQPLVVPAINKGNMLRGGFGHAFRRLCCIPQCKDPRTCPLTGSCPYKAVFEPSPPPGAESLSKNQDIPRPFVFRAPHTQQTRFEPGQAFEFGLVLIGRALDFLPYFVLSFRDLAADGVGLSRAKCILERVEHIKMFPDGSGPRDCDTEVIYTAVDQLFRTARVITVGELIKNNLLPNSSDRATVRIIHRVTIQFMTPTFLRAGGEVIRRPEFHHLFKRLRDRINALNTFFGDGPLDADFRGLGDRAEKVQTVSSKIEWIERFRTSSKTKQRHELSGFIGQVTYEGEMGEFLPWLTLGKLVHVGKHTAWGNGQYGAFLTEEGWESKPFEFPSTKDRCGPQRQHPQAETP